MSNTESASTSKSFFDFEVLLNDIKTVNSVNIKPDSVKETVDKSETTDKTVSSLGIVKLYFFHNTVIRIDKEMAKRQSQKTGLLKYLSIIIISFV